jgi:hypothetical protein
MTNFVLLMLVITAPFGVRPISAQSPTKESDAPKVQFVIGPSYVLMPEGVFILIRKGREIGAFRFSSIQKNADNNGKSTYESFFQGDESGSFVNSNVVRRTGEIEIKSMRGFHFFAWQPGQNKLLVGKWWFGCLSPNLVNMSTHFSEEDEGFEFAPTSAQKVTEIDPMDSGLKWFRYNADTSVRIPVSNLPK